MATRLMCTSTPGWRAGWSRPGSSTGRTRVRRLALARIAALAALLLGLAAAGCGSSDDSGDTATAAKVTGPLAQVYDQARDEPRLVWYTSADPSRNDAVVAAFEQRYPGVEVEALRLATGPLATRYEQERDARIVNAGIVTLADPVFIARGLEQGWFTKLAKDELPSVRALPKRYFHDGVATASIVVLGISWNTNVVEGDPPATWEDLLAPEYKDQILLGDPRNVPAYMALARIWQEHYGDEFLERLAAQNPTLVDSIVPGTQQLAAGQKAVAIPNVGTVVDPLAQEGAPIDFDVPELTTGLELEAAISDGTKSPNTAKLLYDFLLTEEGQIAYNGTSGASPLGPVGDTQPLPRGYVAPGIAELGEHEAELLRLLGIG